MREAFTYGSVGIKPVEVVGENYFGNHIIKDEEGKYWWLSPEGYFCKVIAANRTALDIQNSSVQVASGSEKPDV